MDTTTPFGPRSLAMDDASAIDDDRPQQGVQPLRRRDAGAERRAAEAVPADAVLDLRLTFAEPLPTMPGDAVPLQPPVPTIKAVIDGLDDLGCITGWSCALDRLDERATVNLLYDGEVILAALANLARPDVRMAGIGDGRYGFVLPIPEAMFDGGTHAFSVLAEIPGSGVCATAVTFELPTPLRQRGRTIPDTKSLTAVIPRLKTIGDLAAVYSPGYYVPCMLPHPKPVYHISGWHEPEEHFSRIHSRNAVIEMLVRKPADHFILQLDVEPCGSGPHVQTLEVFFNFFRVGYFQIDTRKSVHVELPAELFILPRAKISLRCEYAFDGSDLGDEDRRRGVAIIGWRLA